MRPIWSGALSFGLINIPIQLYSGTTDRGISFDMLHKKDLSPIRFARMCKAEEKEVPWEEIVKGYEYEKGEYVVLTEEDFVKASPKRTKTLEISCFCDEAEIDSMLFEKPYFLEPGKGAGKTYLLLNEALKKAGKVAVATYVLHTKAHVGMIKPYGRGLILNQLRFESELKKFEEIELPVAKIQPKELETAIKLIDQLTESFDASQYKDTYTDDVKALIEEKLNKKPRKKKAAAEEVQEFTPVEDIMSKLKASLDKYQPKPKISRSRSRVKAKS